MRAAWLTVWRLYKPVAYLASGVALIAFPFDRWLSAVVLLSAAASMAYFLPAAMAMAALILSLKEDD